MGGPTPPESAADERATLRRALSWALVVALRVAALTAIAAIFTGDFDATDGRHVVAPGAIEG